MAYCCLKALGLSTRYDLSNTNSDPGVHTRYAISLTRPSSISCSSSTVFSTECLSTTLFGATNDAREISQIYRNVERHTRGRNLLHCHAAA